MLQRDLRLINLGLRAQFRNPAFRMSAVVAALGCGAYAANQGQLAGSAANVLSLTLGRALGIGASLWFGYAAIRDLNSSLGAILRAKPVDGARWVWLNWFTGLLLWLSVAAVAFLGAAVGQLPSAGVASIHAYLLAFGRTGLVIAAVSGLSYGLSRLLRSPLGGVIIMFAWFCAISGLTYIPGYLQPDYTQNVPLFLPAGALVLAVTGLIVERIRRGEFRQPAVPIVVTVVLLALAAGGSAFAYHSAPDEDRGNEPYWQSTAAQYLDPGSRIPGFWLPDGHGGTIRTADYIGKIMVVYLFAADDMESARTLAALEAIQKRYGSRGVQVIGVCLSPNRGDAWALARAGGYHFPIGGDPSTVKTAAPPNSAVADAYNIQLLPMLVVTDRRRQAQVVLTAHGSYGFDEISSYVEPRLTAEPE